MAAVVLEDGYGPAVPQVYLPLSGGNLLTL
jgi:hypothetical protein